MFSVDDILGAIQIGENSALDEIDLLNFIEAVPEDKEAAIKAEFLEDMVATGKLTPGMYEKIYELIPDGSVFTYEVSGRPREDNGTEQEIKVQEVRYIKNDNVQLNTKIRTAQAIISEALQSSIATQLVDTQGEYQQFSDYIFYTDYDTIEPGFAITSVLNPGYGVGFFEKYFPDDGHLKFDFNSDDDTMFCVFSALFKQNPNLFTLCGYPVTANKEETYISIIDKCRFHIENIFCLTADRVKSIYDTFAKTFNLSLNIRYYYMKARKAGTSVNNLSHTKLKFDYGKTDNFSYVIAKLGNHMFNINKKDTKRSDALNYLQELANNYDSLKNRKYLDYKTLSRKHASQIHAHHKKLLSNPDQLLIDQDESDLYVPPNEKTGDMGTEESKVIYVPFVFDFETVLNSKNEHCIYSYVIKKVGDEQCGFYYNRFPFDEEAKDAVLKKLFRYVIDNTEEKERAILMAHNGAGFDNLLVLDMACNSLDMCDFKEISTGPGNNIMLSLDITYKYKAKKQDRKYQKKIISFRDSHKILDCRAADIPKNYGIKTFKLPYSYKLYNKLFTVPDRTTTKSWQLKQMNRYISTKEDSYKFEDKEFCEEYENLISGKILSDPNIEDNMKKDIINYIRKTKEQGVYYLPEEYCYLYNRYDVIVVEQGLLKMQEYIRSIGSQESIIKLLEEKIAQMSDTESIKAKSLLEMVKNDTTLQIPAAANLDIFKYRSLASLVFNLCKDDGVFNNIYKLTGNLKLFIQQSVVGGKVMKNPNKEDNLYQSKFYDYFMNLQGKEVSKETNDEILKKALEDSMIDNDAVSLYPSAVSICLMPAGKPTIKNITNPESQLKAAELIPQLQAMTVGEKQQRYFYCLDLETRKDLEFPILSEKDDEGIRRFRNGKFNKIVIGDVALADVIKYQDAVVTRVYTIIRFSEVCGRFATFIKTLFTLRVIFKTIKLPCQNAIKLLMCSSYGRTILKQNLYKKSFKRVATESERQAFLKYVSKNYHLLKPEIIKVGAFVKIQKHNLKDIPEGYPHVGTHILEMSKKLMNSMFNKLYSNGFKVYYTDTDSIHVKADSLTKIGNMLGEQMTQFHSDFGAEGYYGVSDPKLGNTNPGIFAIKSIFVMKKCYYDKLFCINAKTNTYEIIEHKRVKGIASEFMTEERYEQLLLDRAKFQCNICDYRDMVLRKTKNGKLVSLESFNRFIRMTD